MKHIIAFILVSSVATWTAALAEGAGDAMPTKDKLAAAAEAETPDLRTITLVGFECGDNCYLVYRQAGGKNEQALCNAKACDSWNETQALPEALAGREAKARFGIAAQLDSDGNTMSDDFPSVEELLLP